MTRESPSHAERYERAAATVSYDRPLGAATLTTVTDHTLEPRRSGPVLSAVNGAGVFLCELPGRVVWWYIGLLAAAGFLGAWAGDRAARRGIGRLQSPALAKLRGLLSRARSVALASSGLRSELLEVVQAADDATRDLELPAGYHPRRSTRPLSDAERPLGQRESGRNDA